jgi:hypothetical protein
MTNAWSVKVGVVGAKDAIKELRKLDPELRKAFNNKVKQVAEPALNDARKAYKFVPLSGMEFRSWGGGSKRKRGVFPISVARAARGVKVKIDTRSKPTATIYIQQTDPGWAVFETAGRKTVNVLGERLNAELGEVLEPGKTRLLGRVVFKEKAKVEREITELVKRTANVINGKLKPRREDFDF